MTRIEALEAEHEALRDCFFGYSSRQEPEQMRDLKAKWEAVEALPTPSQRAGRPELDLSKEQVSTALERLLGANGSYSDPFGLESRPITKLCKDWLALEAYCDTLESQRAGSDTEGAWRPIETAPRDGTRLLLYWPKHEVVIGGGIYESMEDTGTGQILCRYWVSDNEFCIEDGPDDTPTHWMPLPTTPATSDEGEKPKQEEETCSTCLGFGRGGYNGSDYFVPSQGGHMLCPTCHGSGKHPTSKEGE